MKVKLLQLASFLTSAVLALLILAFSLNQASADSLESTFSAPEASGSPQLDLKEASTPAVLGEEATAGGSLLADPPLPYPGMLPDSPVYWAKMVRDRVRLFFTHQPERKASLLFLYADKRLSATVSLVKLNKLSLAAQTATKAEMYLVQAKTEIEKAAQKGSETSLLEAELRTASERHGLILAELDELFDVNRGLLEPAHSWHQKTQ